MSKLYTIKITYDYVVVAEDEKSAYHTGLNSAREALLDLDIHDCDIDVTEGVHAYGWYDDCIPYGGDGNTRTGDYLKG